MSSKISLMTVAAALGGTEDVPVVQGAANKRTTPAAIKTFVLAGGTPNTIPQYNATGDLESSAITPSELANLAGVSGNVQGQIDAVVIDVSNVQGQVNLLIGGASAPTIVAEIGAGAGATASILGTSNCGVITLNSGGGCAAGLKIATITFTGGFSFPTACFPMLQADDNATTNLQFKHLYTVGGTATWEIWVSSTTGLTDATTYKWKYMLTGY